MRDESINLLKSVGHDLLDLALVCAQVAVMGIITFYAARFIGGLVEKTLARRSYGQDGALLIGRLSSVVTWVVGISWVITSLGVNSTGLIAFLSASTVAISLSLQDILKNFVAGIFLLIERPFRIGDRIRVRDVVGDVQGIDIRTTLIRNSEGALVMVPNATIFTEILTNRSHFRTRRLDVTITSATERFLTIETTLGAALGGLKGLRQPTSTPIMRSSSPDETVVELSLLIESSPEVEHEVVKKLVEAFPDAKLEVTKP